MRATGHALLGALPRVDQRRDTRPDRVDRRQAGGVGQLGGMLERSRLEVEAPAAKSKK